MTHDDDSRPAARSDPPAKFGKKGHSGRVSIFYVSNRGGQKNNKTPSFLRLRRARKNQQSRRKRRGNRMEFVIRDIAHAAPNMQLVILVDQHPRHPLRVVNQKAIESAYTLPPKKETRINLSPRQNHHRSQFLLNSHSQNQSLRYGGTAAVQFEQDDCCPTSSSK